MGCHSHRVHLGSLHSLPTRPQLLQGRPRSLPRHGLPLEGNEELPTMLPTSPSASLSPPTLHHTLWDRNARGTTRQSSVKAANQGGGSSPLAMSSLLGSIPALLLSPKICHWGLQAGEPAPSRRELINCPSLTTPGSAPPGMLQVGGRGLELSNEAPRGFLSRSHSLPAHSHQVCFCHLPMRPPRAFTRPAWIFSSPWDRGRLPAYPTSLTHCQDHADV